MNTTARLTIAAVILDVCELSYTLTTVVQPSYKDLASLPLLTGLRFACGAQWLAAVSLGALLSLTKRTHKRTLLHKGVQHANTHRQ